MLSSAAAEHEVARDLIVTLVNPVAEIGLETGPDAADENRVPDDVVGQWLVDSIRHVSLLLLFAPASLRDGRATHSEAEELDLVDRCRHMG